jgi:hypothetical protein
MAARPPLGSERLLLPVSLLPLACDTIEEGRPLVRGVVNGQVRIFISQGSFLRATRRCRDGATRHLPANRIQRLVCLLLFVCGDLKLLDL